MMNIEDFGDEIKYLSRRLNFLASTSARWNEPARSVDTCDSCRLFVLPGRDYILISLPIAAGTGCLSVKCLRPSELDQKRREIRQKKGETRFGARRILLRAFSAERMRIQRLDAAADFFTSSVRPDANCSIVREIV